MRHRATAPANTATSAELRLVEPDDRPLFDGFYERCFEAAYRAVLDPASHERTMAWIRGGGLDDIVFTDPGKRRTFGAWSAERLLGTVGFRIGDRTARIDNLYVDPTLHRGGIGSALLREVVARVPALHYLEIRVLDGSRDAIRFYEALGFELLAHESGRMAPDVSVDQRVMLCPAFVCARRLDGRRRRHSPARIGAAKG